MKHKINNFNILNKYIHIKIYINSIMIEFNHELFSHNIHYYKY